MLTSVETSKMKTKREAWNIRPTRDDTRIMRELRKRYGLNIPSVIRMALRTQQKMTIDVRSSEQEGQTAT